MKSFGCGWGGKGGKKGCLSTKSMLRKVTVILFVALLLV